LPTADFDTLIYVPDWSRREEPAYLLRTDSVIAGLRATGGGAARMLGVILAAFPRRVRDAGYGLVARWRYRIFGPWRPRPLRRPEWRQRYIEG
jgi:predicted DCC family thiol-disulfide oxidoreductase YuxK